jgi:hypothetical protein
MEPHGGRVNHQYARRWHGVFDGSRRLNFPWVATIADSPLENYLILRRRELLRNRHDINTGVIEEAPDARQCVSEKVNDDQVLKHEGVCGNLCVDATRSARRLRERPACLARHCGQLSVRRHTSQALSIDFVALEIGALILEFGEIWHVSLHLPLAIFPMVRGLRRRHNR